MKSIHLYGAELSTSKPNNIVKLDSGEIFSIKKITNKKHRINLHGLIFKNVANAFNYPCESSKVGIMKLGQLSRKPKVVSINRVMKKCVFFENNRQNYAVTLLHVS